MPFSTFQIPENVNEGQQVTVFLQPPVPPGCTFSIRVNSERIVPGNSVGDLKASAFSGSLTTPKGPATGATFTALKNHPNATVTFEIDCPPEHVVQAVSHKVGEGAPPPPPPPVETPDDPNRGDPPQRFDKDFGGPDSQRGR